MSYELRILSGLHRGAILPLDEEMLSIGAGEDADVVLVDSGVEERHARLSMSESGWVIVSNGGNIFSADGTPLLEESEFACGGFVRIGPVWICISEDGDPWPQPPADSISPVVPEPMLDAPLTTPLTTPLAAQEEGGTVSEQPPPNRKKMRRAALMPALVLAVTTAAAAYAFTSKPAQQPVFNEATSAQLNSDKHTGRTSALDAGAAKQKPLALTQEGLQKAFRKRLADAELINRFDLKLEDQLWEMRANLDDDEAARFERVLKTFMDENRIVFPVHARIVPAEGMLPFKISQVMSGTNAGIVTADGRRMYIGDELNGIRLLAVAGNRVKFLGKRKIEIVW